MGFSGTEVLVLIIVTKEVGNSYNWQKFFAGLGPAVGSLQPKEDIYLLTGAAAGWLLSLNHEPISKTIVRFIMKIAPAINQLVKDIF